MKYSPEPAEANTILCLEIFQPKGKRMVQLRTFSITNKASLVDGAAINWSEESAPVKTNINILVM